MKKKNLGLGILICLALSGCTNGDSQIIEDTTEETLHASESTVSLTSGEYSEEELDDTWSKEQSASISLTGDSAEVKGSGAAVEGSEVTISSEGTYVISGMLTDGKIIVNVAEGDVRLVLNGVSITSTDASAIDILQGDTIITLAQDSTNYVADSEAGSQDIERNNAAIFAKDDLIFNGTGSLEVAGNYKNAIQSKDKLKFVSGTYKISSVNHGLLGKDCVTIKGGEFEITAASDGIQASNAEETDKGYIIIDGGSFQITSGTDAIQAETLLYINDGEFNIIAGGGSAEAVQTGGDMMREGGQRGREPGNDAAAEEDTVSTKGLKSYVNLVVAGGNINIDACDDAVHSNDTVSIDGGEMTISTGDDGIHAENELIIDEGIITIETSYEGLEGYTVTINGGTIDLISSDDGINAAQASSESSDGERMGESQGAVFTINGGDILVNASGDGVDANGLIKMTGGSLIVQGPVMGGNGTFDYDEEFMITGGSILSAGTPQMAQTASLESEQGFITGTFDSSIAAGTTITVTDDSGTEVASITTEKESSWYMFSVEDIQKGNSYTVQAGDAKSEVTAE